MATVLINSVFPNDQIKSYHESPSQEYKLTQISLEQAARAGNAQVLQEVLNKLIEAYEIPTSRNQSKPRYFTKKSLFKSSQPCACPPLPNEIWMEILKLLSPKELCVACQLSKQLCMLASTDFLWKKFFPKLIDAYQPSCGLSYKNFCLENKRKQGKGLRLPNMDWNEWNNPVPQGNSRAEYDYLIKLVIIGDSGCGKSSILVRFADHTFTESYITTIGVDFKLRTVGFQGKTVKLQCWDTSGQERFRNVSSSYYRGATGIMLVFDLTNRESWERIKSFWHREAERYAREDVKIIIVGNKADLEGQRAVTTEEIMEYADSINAPYGETSAKNGQNVEEVFASLLNQSMELALQQPAPRPALPEKKKTIFPFSCSIL